MKTADENLIITMATESDRDEILALYKAQIGQEYCPWTDEYPENETIDFDLSRKSLFVMKETGKVIAAVSIDDDENVNKLGCWDVNLAPGGELARVAVLPGWQNMGIAKKMMRYAMSEMKKRGFKSVFFMVNKHNIKAIRAYEPLGFDKVGECYMYEQDFWCYEKSLSVDLIRQE